MKKPVDSSDDNYGHGFTSAGNREAYDQEKEVFGDEAGAAVSTNCDTTSGSGASDANAGQIQYRTMSWQMVAVLMIAEIVSNGMLSLPSSLAVVGIVPGTILIVFLGVFATFTSWVLIQFKLRHPEG
jgi:uncharacterized membrane protein